MSQSAGTSSLSSYSSLSQITQNSLSSNDSMYIALEDQKQNIGQKREYKCLRARIRNSRMKTTGRSYYTRTGRFVAAKTFKRVRKCCFKSCFTKVAGSDQSKLFLRFYKFKTKNLQDNFLAQHITATTVLSAIPPTLSKYKPRPSNWKYSLNLPQPIPVCRKMFLSVFQVSPKRLRILQQKLINDEPIRDRRADHKRRVPIKLSDDIWALMKEHLDSIPATESHYAYKKTKKKYFLNPNLSVKKLYRLFKVFYKKKTAGHRVPFTYETYRMRFRRYTQFALRLPRSDVCDFCFEVKKSGILRTIRSRSSNGGNQVFAGSESKRKNLVEKYLIHERYVAAFKRFKQQIIEESKRDPKIVVLEFDYAQNIPLPKLNVNAQFYCRLFWLYVFNIHMHHPHKSTFYYFLENEGRKNANSVCSLLYDFISRHVPEGVEKIYLISDNAGGQNKNRIVVSFLAWLSETLSVEIEHVFPIRGHTYSVCDRNFGTYTKQMKKIEVIETPKQVAAILHKFKTYETVHFTNFRDWDQALVRSVIQRSRERFKIREYKRMLYKGRDGKLLTSATYSATYAAHSVTHTRLRILDLEEADPPSISQPKKNDLRKLLRFLSRPSKKYFVTNVLS